MKITAGATNVSLNVYFVDDDGGTAPGEPTTGLLFSDIETGGSASYARQGAARVDVTLKTLASASAAHDDGGFILIDDTNMPGVYRVDIPDAAFASGVSFVTIHMVAASANNSIIRPLLVDIDPIPALIAAVQADTDDIQSRIPAALVSGAMDCDVSAMQAGVVTAAAVATDAIDADAIAADGANEIADALLNRDMSAVTDSNTRSPLNALRHIRNKWSISGTTLTVTKEDDSTAAWTATLTEDASANPITGSDPA